MAFSVDIRTDRECDICQRATDEPVLVLNYSTKPTYEGAVIYVHNSCLQKRIAKAQAALQQVAS